MNQIELVSAGKLLQMSWETNYTSLLIGININRINTGLLQTFEVK